MLLSILIRCGRCDGVHTTAHCISQHPSMTIDQVKEAVSAIGVADPCPHARVGRWLHPRQSQVQLTPS